MDGALVALVILAVGSLVVPTAGYSAAPSGGGERTTSDWPALLLTVAGVILACMLPALLALLLTWARVGGRHPLRGRALQGLFWTATALGTLMLALMTYALDPFGFQTQGFWALDHEPPPTPGPGLYMMYAGALAIILGGILAGGPRAARGRA